MGHPGLQSLKKVTGYINASASTNNLKITIGAQQLSHDHVGHTNERTDKAICTGHFAPKNYTQEIFNTTAFRPFSFSYLLPETTLTVLEINHM